MRLFARLLGYVGVLGVLALAGSWLVASPAAASSRCSCERKIADCDAVVQVDLDKAVVRIDTTTTLCSRVEYKLGEQTLTSTFRGGINTEEVEIDQKTRPKSVTMSSCSICDDGAVFESDAQNAAATARRCEDKYMEAGVKCTLKCSRNFGECFAIDDPVESQACIDKRVTPCNASCDAPMLKAIEACTVAASVNSLP